MDPQQIAYDDQGLVSCVIQDHESGEVLTLAYMNAKALARTIATGEVHLFSRSRQQQWHKGETSGNTLAVQALRLDCDGDAILALVAPGRDADGASRPACHTGQRTCFHRDLEPRVPAEALADLERTVRSRVTHPVRGSYTASLLDDPERIGEKVREEAEEVARAAREESDERVAEEAADALYHLTVLLSSRGLALADAERVLDGRRR